MKTSFDLFIALIIGTLLFPVFIIFSLLIFLQDFKNPFYVTERVGKNFKIFKMFKFRSMIVNADKNKVFSTSLDDKRITKIGHFIRKYKIDELPQILNVLSLKLSLVGPRPNVKFEVDKYNEHEKKLLSIKPGITDFASIVFSDEAEILNASKDPNKDYEILIRPFKSQLGLKYIQHSSLITDFRILILTVFSLFNRKYALEQIYNFFKTKNYSEESISFILREKSLKDYSQNIFIKND